MALAASLGIAPKRLWGDEPREVTTHEYDEAGRLVRSVTVRDPEFDPESVDLLRAWQDAEDDRHACGHLFSESSHPDNEGRYEVPPPTRCHACTAIASKSAEYRDAPQPNALSFAARLKS